MTQEQQRRAADLAAEIVGDVERTIEYVAICIGELPNSEMMRVVQFYLAEQLMARGEMPNSGTNG